MCACLFCLAFLLSTFLIINNARAVVEEQQLRRAEAAVAPVVDEKERCIGARVWLQRSAAQRSAQGRVLRFWILIEGGGGGGGMF